MNKKIPALMAAFLITAILAAGLLLVGQDAVATSSAAAAPALNASAAMQIQQILVQYQTRELQYQTLLKSADERVNQNQQQIEHANLQIQQYQTIMAQLQNKGLVTVASDGTITIH